MIVLMSYQVLQNCNFNNTYRAIAERELKRFLSRAEKQFTIFMNGFQFEIIFVCIIFCVHCKLVSVHNRSTKMVYWPSSLAAEIIDH